MKKFLVQYCYYTDNRTEITVEANDIISLVLIVGRTDYPGLGFDSINTWFNSGPGFHVRISIVE